MKLFSLILILLSLFYINAQGQIKIDSLNQDYSFKYKHLILPSTLITFGAIGSQNKEIKKFNNNIKRYLNKNTSGRPAIDNYMQYAPMLSTYGLNLMGIKSKNNIKNQTLILGTAYLIMGIAVNTTKYLTKVERPDGSMNNSFPSGHTATAFMGAEFMFQEYKDTKPFLSMTGYLIATATGYYRIQKNKHWFTDVVAGAGVGILSTKIAYWINPWLKRTIFRGKSKINSSILPFYNGKDYGIALTMAF